MDTKKPLHEATAPATEREGTSIETKAVERSVATEPLGKQPPERSEGEAAKARVVASDETLPLPGQPRKPVVVLDLTKPVDGVLDIDKDTVVYLVYLLYKTNMIARNNLRNMIDQISKPLPDNVLKWLVNEAAKAGR
jgi:hypothetical protein